jgi:hypothetical protein
LYWKSLSRRPILFTLGTGMTGPTVGFFFFCIFLGPYKGEVVSSLGTELTKMTSEFFSIFFVT